MTTTTPWAETLSAKLDTLTWAIERGDRENAATLSPRARERNGLRSTPGRTATWRLVATGDPVLSEAIAIEYGTYSTRKAAEADIPAAVAWLRDLYASRYDYAHDAENL